MADSDKLITYAPNKDFELHQSIDLRIVNIEEDKPEHLAKAYAEPIRKLNHNYPKREVWVVQNALGNNYFDLQSPVGDEVMERVRCIDPRLASVLTSGVSVIVGFENSNRQKPYIKSAKTLSQSAAPVDISEIPIIPAPPVIVTFTAEMWIQAGAFWWSSYSALNACLPFNFGTEVNVIEDYPANGPIGDVGDGRVKVHLTLFPSGTILKTMVVKVNGSVVQQDTTIGAITYSIIGPDTNDDVYIPIPGMSYSSVTSVQVTYTYIIPGVVTLNPEVVGSDKAISMRGIAMFPDTTPDKHQMVSMLTANYVPRDGEIIAVQYHEFLDIPYSGLVYSLSTTHIPKLNSFTGNLYSSTADAFKASHPRYIVGNIEDRVYVFARANYIKTAGYIDISYKYYTNPPTTQTFSITAGESGIFNDEFDNVNSTSKTFTVSHPPINFAYSVNVNGLSNEEAPAHTDTTITTTIDINIGDNVYLSYEGHTSIRKFDVGVPIAELLYVAVDNTPDLLATFSGSVVTLSSDAPNNSTVDISVKTGAFESITETLALTISDDYEFTLAHTPITGTVTIPPALLNGEFGYAQGGSLGNSFDGSTHDEAIISIVNGNKVKFAYPIVNNGLMECSYKYDKIDGTLFNIDTAIIKEVDIVTNVSKVFNIPIDPVFNANPDKLFISQAEIDSVDYDTVNHVWKDNSWQGQWWGYFQYDPSCDGYTVISPAGIHWRSRTSGQELNKHYTTTPWKVEELAKDYTFYRTYDYYNYSIVDYPTDIRFTLKHANEGLSHIPVKQRTAPYMGCSIAGPYVLQGSYGCVGPNQLDLTPGYFHKGTLVNSWRGAEPDFLIRFYIRDKKKKFILAKELSVRKLVADTLVGFPLFIGGAGIIHSEGKDIDGPGYPHGRFFSNFITPGSSVYTQSFRELSTRKPRNSWWPAIKEANIFVVGAGWCCADWGNTTEQLKDEYMSNMFTTRKCGVDDAGYTINLVKANGIILDQYTIKCDPTYIETAISNPSVVVDYDLAHSGDGLYIDKVFYVSENIAASRYFGVNSEGADSWFAYLMKTVDGAAKSPHLLHAGIPALADGNPRYATVNTSSNFNSISIYGNLIQQEEVASQAITVDHEGYIYVVMSIPYWTKLDHYTIQKFSENITGSFLLDAVVSGLNIFYVNGFFFSSIIDEYDNSIADPLSYPNPRYPRDGSTRMRVDENYGPYVVSIEYIAVYAPPPHAHEVPALDGNGNPILDSDGRPTYTIAYDIIHYPNTTVPFWTEVPLRSLEIFDVIDLHTAGIRFYVDTGDGRVHNARHNAQIITVYDAKGDHRQQYGVDARTVMYKFKTEGDKIEKVWEKDVSFKYTDKTSDYSYQGLYYSYLPISKFAPVYFWRPCGRFIFLLRLKPIDAVGSGPSVFNLTHALVLEAWVNPPIPLPPDAHPGDAVPTLKHTASLPGYIEPVATDYHGPLVNPEMTEGIDELGHEWVLVTADKPVGSGLYITHYTPIRFLITFKEDINAAPDINHNEVDKGDIAPLVYNTQGMTAANDLYCWSRDDGSVIIRGE